jgi:hypothetical protein
MKRGDLLLFLQAGYGGMQALRAPSMALCGASKKFPAPPNINLAIYGTVECFP